MKKKRKYLLIWKTTLELNQNKCKKFLDKFRNIIVEVINSNGERAIPSF